MNPLYYFLIFFFGFVFVGDMRFQKSIDKLTWIALAYGVAETAINIIFPIRNFTQWTPQWMALGLTYQMGRWMLTLAALGLGHRFLNRTSDLLRYASAAAMPFYLLHMTFSVITGYFVIQLDAPLAVKYSAHRRGCHWLDITRLRTRAALECDPFAVWHEVCKEGCAYFFNDNRCTK